jgi:hypothetical protein
VSGALRIALVLVAAVAATIVANVVLLGVASGRHDPVGRLTPQTARIVKTAPVPHPQPPAPPPHPGREREDD